MKSADEIKKVIKGDLYSANERIKELEADALALRKTHGDLVSDYRASQMEIIDLKSGNAKILIALIFMCFAFVGAVLI